MSKKAKNSAIKVIAYCIEKDEDGIRKLLKKNGVDTSLVVGRNKLTKVFMDAMAKSKRLAIEFVQYVEAKKKSFNASGREQVGTVNVLEPIGIKPVSIPTNTTTNTTSNSSNQPSSGFFSGLNLQDLINTGVGVLAIQRDIKVSENEKEAVTSAVDVERDRIKLNPQNGGSSNTLLYATLGVVGLVGLGAIVFFWKNK